MNENTIVQAKISGSRKMLYKKFDEFKKKYTVDWDYRGTNNPDVYFTENEAIEHAKSCQGISYITDIEVIQPLANDELYILDYKSDEIKYHLKKAPTVK